MYRKMSAILIIFSLIYLYSMIQVSNPTVRILKDQYSFHHEIASGNNEDTVLDCDSQTRVSSIYFNMKGDVGINRRNVLSDMEITDIKLYSNLGVMLIMSNCERIQQMQRLDASLIFGNPYDQAFELFAIENNPKINYDIDLPQLNALSPNSSFQGEGIKIGIVDSGVDVNHPDLNNANISQSDFNFAGTSPGDRDHGTKVASMIVGNDGEVYGSAPNATIISAAMGSVGNSITGDFLAAFDYLISQEVDVINTSFGGNIAMWEPIVKSVVEEGIVVVGAVGNQNGEQTEAYSVEGPGSVFEAIGVGGVNKTNDLWLPDVGLWGPTRNNYNKPDVVAVARNVKTARGTFSGTSYSSPSVAGVVGVLIEILKQNGMNIHPLQVKAYLMNSATYIAGENYLVGVGLPNITRMIENIDQFADVYGIIDENKYGNEYLDVIYIENLYRRDFNVLSNVENITIDYDANTSNFISNITISGKYQFKVNIYIQCKTFCLEGIYDLSLSLKYMNTTFDSITLSFELQTGGKGTVLYDISLTDWDDLPPYYIDIRKIHGTGITRLVTSLHSLRYSVIEGNDNSILRQFMEQINILWLISPLPLSTYYEYWGGYKNLDLSYFSDIKEFLSRGGNIVLDASGLVGNEETLTDYASDIYTINSFLEEYGVNFSTEYLSTTEYLAKEIMKRASPIPILNMTYSELYMGGIQVNAEHLNDYNAIPLFHLKNVATYEQEVYSMIKNIDNHSIVQMPYDVFINDPFTQNSKNMISYQLFEYLTHPRPYIQDIQTEDSLRSIIKYSSNEPYNYEIQNGEVVTTGYAESNENGSLIIKGTDEGTLGISFLRDNDQVVYSRWVEVDNLAPRIYQENLTITDYFMNIPFNETFVKTITTTINEQPVYHYIDTDQNHQILHISLYDAISGNNEVKLVITDRSHTTEVTLTWAKSTDWSTYNPNSSEKTSDIYSTNTTSMPSPVISRNDKLPAMTDLILTLGIIVLIRYRLKIAKLPEKSILYTE